MSVWLALFPFLGFLYALCHGLLQALYESGYRHCRCAGSDGAHFWQYSAVFVRRHNHGGGVLCYICFSLSLQSAAKRFLFIPAGDSAHFLLCQVGDRGIGAFAGLLRRRDRMLVVAAADSSQVACSTGCRLRPAAAGSCLCSGGGLLLYLFAMRRYGWQGVAILDPAYRYRRLFAPGTDFLCRVVSRFPVRAKRQPVRIVALVSPIAYVPFGVQGVFDFHYLLLAALLVGAVSFFAGMFFYRRRSGECAEQTLSTPVVYVLATTGAALSLVCLPMLLTLQANQYGVYALLCGAGVGVMTLVCTLVYTRKVVNPTAAVLCSTLVVVTVGTVCLLGVQGSDYRNKVPAAEDVAQVTVQPGWCRTRWWICRIICWSRVRIRFLPIRRSRKSWSPAILLRIRRLWLPLCSCIGIALPQQRLRRWAAAA